MSDSNAIPDVSFVVVKPDRWPQTQQGVQINRPTSEGGKNLELYIHATDVATIIDAALASTATLARVEAVLATLPSEAPARRDYNAGVQGFTGLKYWADVRAYEVRQRLETALKGGGG